MAVKILIGGSPCTYWSIAQTNGRETKAEGMGWELFKNYRIAKEKFKPDFFLYENNKSASQAIKDQIAEEFGVGVDPKVRFTYINSALVSAQNRQRFYVTNFGDIEQPEDRGILLKDILERGNGSDDPIRIPEYGDSDKARPVNAYYSNNCGGFEHRMFNPNPAKQQVDMIAVPVNTTPDGKSQTIKAQYQNTSTVNVCCYKSTYGATGVAEPVNPTTDGKAHTVTASYYKIAENPFSEYGSERGRQRVAEPVRVGSLPRPNGELSTSQAMQIYSQDGKSTTQMAGGGGLGGKTGLYAIPVEFEDGVPTKAVSCADGKTYTVYEVKDGKITIKGKEYPIKLKDGYYIIRKLTVRECARLQTMPDDYCKAVSDSQAYKALGNGWTAEVIIHLLNHALKDVPRDEEIIVLSMYDGIATGRYCLDKMGFTNVTYHAYEIDKYPIMVAKDNYPDIIEHGDAFAVREDDWKPPQTRSEWLDDLLGGAL